MMRWIGAALIVLAAGLTLNGAWAQDTKRAKLDFDAVFKKLDANNDSKLSKDEFLKLADRFKDKEKARQKLASVFEKIDPQNKGLTKAQFRTYLEGIKKTDERSTP